MLNPQILLVEDERLVALDICKQLNAFGYQAVWNVGNSDKALAVLQDQQPDLALLDINIDGSMDGIELAAELRSRCATPVIFLTAFADSETLERAKRTEPYGYLIKPVDARELRSTIEVTLFRRQLEIARRRSQEKGRELERQLFQTQKMETVGKLSEGIAHELNNKLFVVKGNLELVNADTTLSPGGQDLLRNALEQCSKAEHLIKQLLGLARKGKYHPERVDLVTELSDVLQFLKAAFEFDGDITASSHGHGLAVVVDRRQFRQIVTNVVLNAKQAMPEGGEIKLSVDREYVVSPGVYNPDAKPGDFVVLRVQDRGEGIDASIIDRIFEPFFTTRTTGEACGLGLSVVYGVLQRHGGWVSVESEVGEGTTISMYFPEASGIGEKSLDEERKQLPTVGDGSGIVMIIDDEAAIVDVFSKLLEFNSISAKGFTDPIKALSWYEQNYRDVSAIILDMRMPIMDGASCFQEIIKRDPDACVMLFSGYAKDETVEELLAKGAHGFFEKPIEFKQMLDRINEIVKGKSALNA